MSDPDPAAATQGSASPVVPTPPESTPAPVASATSDAAAPAPAAAPLREDQLQQAVAFLSHPKVKGSPVSMKRSFLERKGLTEAEIQEAFGRVPEEASASTPLPVAQPSSQVPGLVTYAPAPSTQQQPQQRQAQQVQQQAQQQMMVPVSSQGMVPTQMMHPQVVQPPPPQPLRWTQVALGVGVVAAGMYAIRSLVFPYISSVYEQWSSHSKAIEEERAKKEAAALEALETMKACQQELSSATHCLAEAVELLKEQANSSDMLQREQQISTMNALNDVRDALSQLAVNSLTGAAAKSSASLPPWSSNGAHAAIYGGLLGSSNNPYSSTAIPKPPGGYLGGGGGAVKGATPSSSTTSSQRGGEPAYPPSFMDVMDLVAKGITPPNVRHDIQDQPPDPSRPPTEAAISQRPKPWMQPQYSSSPTASTFSAVKVDPVVFSGIPSSYLQSTVRASSSVPGMPGGMAPAAGSVPQSEASNSSIGAPPPASNPIAAKGSLYPMITPSDEPSGLHTPPGGEKVEQQPGTPPHAGSDRESQQGASGRPPWQAPAQPQLYQQPMMGSVSHLAPALPHVSPLAMQGASQGAEGQASEVGGAGPRGLEAASSSSQAFQIPGASASGIGSGSIAGSSSTSARTPLSSMLTAGGMADWKPPPPPEPTVKPTPSTLSPPDSITDSQSPPLPPHSPPPTEQQHQPKQIAQLLFPPSKSLPSASSAAASVVQVLSSAEAASSAEAMAGGSSSSAAEVARGSSSEAPTTPASEQAGACSP